MTMRSPGPGTARCGGVPRRGTAVPRQHTMSTARRLLRPVATALALVLLAAVPAQAAVNREVIDGEVLHLVSVQDPEAMASMRPGEVVRWDVRVSSKEPDGEITLELAAEGDGTGFEVEVHSCTAAGTSCRTELLAPRLAQGVLPLGRQGADEVVWYRIGVRLAAHEPVRTLLTFTARGQGEEVSTDGEAELSGTGTSPWPTVGLAAAAWLLGIILARLAGALRKTGVRP